MTPRDRLAARLRLRLLPLLERRGWNAYRLSVESDGRISQSTAHRLLQKIADDDLRLFDAAILEALCDVLEVEPGELFERDAKGAKRRPRR